MDGDAERWDTIVIGGGQAGLITGYYLQRAGHRFVILDAGERVGQAWRDRWDSLRLFTPPWVSTLPGMGFPRGGVASPTKDEMADYVEAYAERFALPVRLGVRVDGLTRDDDGFVVAAGDRVSYADRVVIATGAHSSSRTPAFARELDPEIVQLHSMSYRNPGQLKPGGVLVVGAGNSGADISIELVRTHPTWLSGRYPSHVPVHVDSTIVKRTVLPIVRFLGTHVLTTRTPMGRKARQTEREQGGRLVRVKPKWLERAGVEHVGKTAGAKDGKPMLEDGQVLDVANVIWCTGFRQDLSWVDLPITDEDGEVVHRRGLVPAVPGLAFVGLEFQYSATSGVVLGMPRDARYVVEHLDGRTPRRQTIAAA